VSLRCAWEGETRWRWRWSGNASGINAFASTAIALIARQWMNPPSYLWMRIDFARRENAL
jgi:hypothetical protein